jgi:hypothetical protein
LSKPPQTGEEQGQSWAHAANHRAALTSQEPADKDLRAFTILITARHIAHLARQNRWLVGDQQCHLQSSAFPSHWIGKSILLASLPCRMTVARTLSPPTDSKAFSDFSSSENCGIPQCFP